VPSSGDIDKFLEGRRKGEREKGRKEERKKGGREEGANSPAARSAKAIVVVGRHYLRGIKG